MVAQEKVYPHLLEMKFVEAGQIISLASIALQTFLMPSSARSEN